MDHFTLRQIHTVRISASDNVGNSDYEEVTVDVFNAVTSPEETTTTTTDTGETNGGTSIPAFAGPLILIIILVVIVGIAATRRKGQDLPPAPPVEEVYQPPPKPPEELQPETMKEREIITERVMVICPYCGAKNPQGLSKCQNCNSDL